MKKPSNVDKAARVQKEDYDGPLKSFPLPLVDVLENLESLGIYITDCERHILFWNKAAEIITGYSSQDVIGRTCHDGVLCHIDRHGRCLCDSDVCPLALSIKQGKVSAHSNFIFGKSKSGNRIPMAVSVSPIKDHRGQVIGGMETFRDATAEIEDLELAQAVQRQWFPQPDQLKSWPFFGFSCCMAEMVGGDLVRLFPGNGNTVVGLLADVSGHGVASALITGFLVSNLLPLEGKVTSPAKILHILSEGFSKGGVTSHYYSALAFVFDPTTRKLLLSCAGHPHPILLQPGSPAEFVKVGGDLIGLFDNVDFEETEINLSGKRLILYSDGLTEALNPEKEFFGNSRFLQLAQSEVALGPTAQAQVLVDHVFKFTEAYEPKDDLTVFVIDGGIYG